MNNLFQKFGGLAQSAVVKLHVRSALNPMLWLCGIVTPVCLAGAYFFRDISGVRDLLIYLAGAPIVVTLLGFIGFAIFKPEKLQSEEYQLRHESLQIIQQKSGRILIEPTSLEAIANPQNKQLLLEEDNNA